MSDHQEEQEMEAEALSAIFDTAFEIQSPTTFTSASSEESHRQWAVTLLPADILDENDDNCHVAIQLLAKLPLDYPEVVPELDIRILKGLTNDQHQPELLVVANEEAQAQEGLPSIFAICEKLKDWLTDHNIKGLDDVSMHAQMMRRKLEAEKEKQRAVLEFEAQKKEEEMTEAEMEDLEVRKRRAEGTPCTRENFEIWKKQFEAEVASQRDVENDDVTNKSVKKNKVISGDDKAGKLTGFQYFSGKGISSLEAMEAEVEKAEAEAEDEEEDVDLDEDLFEGDDDDLDDLDFDDEDDVDDEDEPDI